MEWNWILEEYDDMVYVSDLNNYELLYVNRAGLDMFHLSREELFSGKKYLCYEIFHGRNTPCPFCTNNYLKDSGFYEWEHYNEQLGKTYLLKDRKVLWDGRESRIEFVFDVSKYKNKLDKQGKQQAAMLRSLPGGIAGSTRAMNAQSCGMVRNSCRSSATRKSSLKKSCRASACMFIRRIWSRPRRRCTRRRKRGGAASCRAGS